jgi:dihydroorotate dehydrogenase (fumarate)
MLATKIHKRNYKTCIYNASGVNCRTLEHLNQLNESIAPIILSKSCTIKARLGNTQPRYYDNDEMSINSSGLPNFGFDYYNNLNFDNKDYFLSLSGLTLDDNIHMVSNISDNISGIELNLSCPNVQGKSQTGYDFEATEETLRKTKEALNNKIIFGVKLPPYFDEIHFNTIADIINEFKINSITCINSIGNGLVIDYSSESVVIKPKNGFGGLGGSNVKATALANVHKLYTLTDCSVIGCGGISTGKDAFEHILCGASAIQVGTCLYKEGTKCFNRIEEELKQVMNEKKYKKLDDFKGNLKYL